MNQTTGKLLLTSAALAALGVVSGCSESGGGGGIIFVSRNTATAFGASGKVFLSERWIVFQADEFTTGPTGTDLNSDGDVIDSVATLVDMGAQTETNLGVAVEDFAILGAADAAQVYLVVSESKDGKDWSGDGPLDDLVLLHVPASGASFAGLTWLCDLEQGNATNLIAAGDRVWFVQEPGVGEELVAGETAIHWIDLAAPTTLQRVPHAITAPGTSSDLVEALQHPSLLAVDGGLLFFTMDETEESATIGGAAGVNLNGGFSDTALVVDSDATDRHVLGVLEAGSATPVARSFGYAIGDDDGPVRALDLGAGDYLIAFLVSEADQGPDNFNVSSAPDLPGSWLPTQCSGEDADMLDDVLHHVHYQAFLTDSDVNRPRNTGLAGNDRVLALAAGGGNFVATLVDEADTDCDLNDDGDLDDEVLRWAPVGGGTAYFTAAAGLLAVEDVAGGLDGVSDFDQRFIAVISESDNDADYNGQVNGNLGFKVQNLVAWLDPSAPSPAWVFDHNPNSAGVQAAGSDWLAERPERDYLLSTFLEGVLGQSLNPGGGDTDILDSLPTFARFQSPLDLDFPGPPVATMPGNPGIVIANGFGFFRVDEADDDRDWNGDGDKTDSLLFRLDPVTLTNTNVLSILNDLPRPAVEVGGTIGAAYIASEPMAGIDFNGDGDTADFVLRWFRIG